MQKIKGLKDLFQLSDLLPDVLWLCQHRQRTGEPRVFRNPIMLEEEEDLENFKHPPQHILDIRKQNLKPTIEPYLPACYLSF